MISRRRFAFWIGFGLFNLSEMVRAETFDKLAAAAMRSVDVKKGVTDGGANQGTDLVSADGRLGRSPALPTHWTATGDKEWRWYERENLIDGSWVSTGITMPIKKATGERKGVHGGYLDENLLPADLLKANQEGEKDIDPAPMTAPEEHLPTAECKIRHGRPPSEWLRSLYADELRIWLQHIKVPEADVSGMTFWEHLTRDHFFDAKHIEGLAIDEQAKLHAAAHFGY
jgi:hypothetical protein